MNIGFGGILTGASLPGIEIGGSAYFDPFQRF
jgi:hypothetical protein